jgi:cyclic-di-AMP phosphodiesterase PgpH
MVASATHMAEASSNRRVLALVAIWLGVSLAGSLLLSPGLSSQQVPELTAADVGRPFRGSSLGGFKASRDVEVVDVAKTRAQREAARDRVRPVFDYDAAVESKIKQAVRSAFAEVAGFQAAGKPPADSKKPTAAPVVPGPLDADAQQALLEARARFGQFVALPEDEDFEALARAHFSSELEQATMQLVELAYKSRVVSAREEMLRFAPEGITVRIVGGSTEYDAETAAPQVFDVKEVGTELDRYASVPGNLLVDASPLLKRAVLRLAKKQIRANLTVNTAETVARRQAALEGAKPVLLAVKKGQRIINDGELVTDAHVLLVQGLKSQLSELDVLQVQVGGFGVVALLLGGVWAAFFAAFKRFRPSRRDALAMGLWGVALLGGLHVWVGVADALHERFSALPVEALHYAFPLAAGAMLVRFVMNEESALFFAVVFSALAALLLGNSLGGFVVSLLTSVVSADRIAKVKDRSGIFRAGFVTGIAGALVASFFALASGKGVTPDLAIGAVLMFVAAVALVPMVVLSLTPLMELAFGYASDLKLLELANLNHPALKELVLQAPGTYHHSIILGSLVEGAAEAIGANSLLARSCAYYHDIGKGRNPACFGENQKGDNPHDAFEPAMSAIIIKRHVTEGLEMAKQYKLPRRVADAIPQHHGTRLVGYFFNKARQRNDGKEAIDESVFRYAGPKPQFREAALVMIADAVEAASRAMPEPTPEKLSNLVQKLINVIFSEGQLDECELTLRDLRLIAESFARTLDGIYHSRPVYPPGAFSVASLAPVGGSAPNLRPLSLVREGEAPKKATPE